MNNKYLTINKLAIMYKVKQSDCIGQLEGFPIEVVQKMIECQVEQGNEAAVRVFQRNSRANKNNRGFEWADTEDNFWREVIDNKNFVPFFKKYPRQEPKESKELNLVEILKDAPKGTKLYSPLFGEVEFESIVDDYDYPIYVTIELGDRKSFSIKGFYYKEEDFPNAECLLFPSKENRDWSTFKVEKPDYPIDTPMMCRDKGGSWGLRYYAGASEVWGYGYKSFCNHSKMTFDDTIPVTEFDFENGCRKELTNTK